MRKGNKLIALLLIMVSTIFSVNPVTAEAKTNNLTAKQILKKATATSSKIKSFTMTQDVQMTLKYDGKTYKQSSKEQVQYNKNPLRVKKVSTFKSNGEKNQSIDYYVKKGSKIYNYAKTANGDYTEIKTHGIKSSDLNGMNPGKQLKELMKYFENTKMKNKTEKVSGRSTYVITAQMDMGKLMELSNDGTDEDLQEVKGQKIKVTYWIDNKTYYPLKCTIDLKSVYNSLLESTPSLKMKVSKCIITVNYTKINKTSKIKLPSVK